MAPADKVFKEWVEIAATEYWGPTSRKSWYSRAADCHQQNELTGRNRSATT